MKAINQSDRADIGCECVFDGCRWGIIEDVTPLGRFIVMDQDGGDWEISGSRINNITKMSSTTVRAPRRELTDEQKNIQEQARTVVKILGLLDTLNEFNLGHIKDACERRVVKQLEREID